MFFCYGEEMLADEGKVIAQRLARNGTKVRYEAFEAMPHVFAPMLVGSKVGERCFEGWAGWMSGVVSGGVDGAAEGAVWIVAKTLEEKSLDVRNLFDIGDEEVARLMAEEKGRRIRGFEEMFGGKGIESGAKL